MQKIVNAKDFAGHRLQKGDTVTTIGDGTSGRICDLAKDDGMQFVQIRPMHQSYGKGVWHAADQVVWTASAQRRKKPANDASKGGTKTKKKK